MTTAPLVLVTDAEQRAALAVVRSLGRAGYRVHVTQLGKHSLSAASRFAGAAHTVADPMRDPVQNAADHARLADTVGAAMVVPVGEATALAVLAAPPASAVVPLPPLAVFRRLCDKAAVHDAARAVGLRVPGQWVVDTPRDAHAMTQSALQTDLRAPLVIKPSRSIAGAGGAAIKLPVRYAASLAEAATIVAETPEAAFPLLLQERVSGDGIGVFHLLHRGRECATFAHRRLREKPPSGGVSTLRESIALPASLHARSLALLDSLGMRDGVAMVEFKGETGGEPGGEPALMEINARFWGSLQLAIDAGVDFPALLAAAVLREAPAGHPTWTPGVRSQWEWGDLDHFLIRLRRGVTRSGQRHAGARAAALREVLRDLPLLRSAGHVREIWRPDDSGPFWLETRQRLGLA